jgi:hypothetical protein
MRIRMEDLCAVPARGADAYLETRARGRSVRLLALLPRRSPAMYKPGADLSVPVLGVDRAVEVKCRADGSRELYGLRLDQHSLSLVQIFLQLLMFVLGRRRTSANIGPWIGGRFLFWDLMDRRIVSLVSGLLLFDLLFGWGRDRIFERNG